jgi:hypothetical protein
MWLWRHADRGSKFPGGPKVKAESHTSDFPELSEAIPGINLKAA